MAIAVAWPAEFLSSNPAVRVRFPAGLAILISILVLYVCTLCYVLRCLLQWP